MTVCKCSSSNPPNPSSNPNPQVTNDELTVRVPTVPMHEDLYTMAPTTGESFAADLLSPMSSCVNDFKANTLHSPRRTQPAGRIAEAAPAPLPRAAVLPQATPHPFLVAELEDLVANPPLSSVLVPAAAAMAPSARPVRSGRGCRMSKVAFSGRRPPRPLLRFGQVRRPWN